jgi:hypothetical protein
MTTGIQQTQDTAVALAQAAANEQGADVALLTGQAAELTIETAEQVAASGALLQKVVARKKAITDLRLSITRPMEAARKAVVQLFAPALEQLQGAEDTIKSGILAYTREQQRLRDEVQARLDAEAEEERKRLLTRAAMQRDIGDEEGAAGLEERSDTVEATPVAPAEKLSGPVHTRVTWHAEVTDLVALAKAYVESEHPPDESGVLDPFLVVLPNMPLLNALARDLKADLNIPGVKAVSEDVVAARGA